VPGWFLINLQISAQILTPTVLDAHASMSM
jgi:hypothetical protein